MDNYYKRPSPQEMRYRDVLRAISDLGPSAKELVEELDEAVRQIVGFAQSMPPSWIRTEGPANCSSTV